MKIIVLVKEVPDTYGERSLNLETGLIERSGENVIDEISERALEAALAFADEHEGAEVAVVAMAPEGATAGIRKCLAMGADTAVHIVDPGLVGADLGMSAEVLAAAVRRLDFDLLVAGDQSTDGAGGVLPVMLAEMLDLPALTNLSSVVIAEDRVTGVRSTDDSATTVSAPLPAVVSVTERLPEARLPNFKGIMAAKKKPLQTLSLVDLGIDPDDMSTPRAIMLGIVQSPARAGGTKIIDEGDGAERLAAFLVESRLV